MGQSLCLLEDGCESSIAGIEVSGRRTFRSAALPEIISWVLWSIPMLPLTYIMPLQTIAWENNGLEGAWSVAMAERVAILERS